MAKATEMTIDGVTFVRKDSIESNVPAQSFEGLEYCIVRTYSAGVFAGYVKSREGKEVKVMKALRLWSWAGAASLSQMAVDGTSKPANCKFPTEVPEVILTEAIEIIPCTEKARLSIESVKNWAE